MVVIMAVVVRVEVVVAVVVVVVAVVVIVVEVVVMVVVGGRFRFCRFFLLRPLTAQAVVGGRQPSEQAVAGGLERVA
jgi:hypothetical protein